MSKERKHDAFLLGFNPPVFPDPAIENLMLAYSEVRGFCKLVLDGIGEKIKGYTTTTRYSTSDGYEWFWGLVFEDFQENKVIVMFPWAQDWKKKDDTQADRSIAVYVSGDVTQVSIKRILNQIRQGILRHNTAGIKKITEYLLGFGMHPGNAHRVSEILPYFENHSEFSKEATKRGYQGDLFQLLLPVFRAIIQSQNDVMRIELKKLSNFGVSDALIYEFIFNMGNPPYMILRRKYGKQRHEEWADEFIEATKKLIFEVVRRKALKFDE